MDDIELKALRLVLAAVVKRIAETDEDPQQSARLLFEGISQFLERDETEVDTAEQITRARVATRAHAFIRLALGQEKP
jgi:hypothetical protein